MTVAPESVIDLMCLEIFPAEASDLRTLLPRNRGRSDTLMGISIFYALPVMVCAGAETTAGLDESCFAAMPRLWGNDPAVLLAGWLELGVYYWGAQVHKG